MRNFGTFIYRSNVIECLREDEEECAKVLARHKIWNNSDYISKGKLNVEMVLRKNASIVGDDYILSGEALA